MDLVEATEGKTTFLVPVQDDTIQFPPGSAPVFFNRRMELNRDATVLLLPLLEPSDYLDAMGATGIRGLRVANECRIPVTISDRDPGAIDLITRNAIRAGLPVTVIRRDANALLSEQSFDAVDLDPFGTPAPFIDAGVRGTRRFLFVTATDTAPLCGAHLKAGIRRYSAFPMNTEYHSEVGLRILLGFVVRETARYRPGSGTALLLCPGAFFPAPCPPPPGDERGGRNTTEPRVYPPVPEVPVPRGGALHVPVIPDLPALRGGPPACRPPLARKSQKPWNR